MKEAAANLEFEEAARLRDEIKRLQAVELAVGDDPLARQEAVEAAGGGFAGERPSGRAANCRRAAPQADRRRHGPAQFGRRRGAAERRRKEARNPSPVRERAGVRGVWRQTSR